MDLSHKMVDCHAHLLDPLFNEDLNECLERAFYSGISDIVCVTETLSQAKELIELQKTSNESGSSFPVIHACIGIHPCSFTSFDDVCETIELLNQHKESIVGIGEVGLDFSPHVLSQGSEVLGISSEQVKELQRHVFAQFIQAAIALDLPLNVHSRSAGHHAIQMLSNAGIQRALLHAFDGRPHYAEQAAHSGMTFSAPTNIVRSPQFENLIRRLPLESIVIETDSPALATEKGERNEPSRLIYACRKVAEIHSVDEDLVAQITSNNARKLFNI